MVGMTVPDISGKAIANLGYEDIEHLAPVFIGDTLYAETTILFETSVSDEKDRELCMLRLLGIINVERM